MKKILATVALAFVSLAVAITTHADKFYPVADASLLTDSALLTKYHNDSHAVAGSYLEVRCRYGQANDVFLITDNQSLKSYERPFPGKYTITFRDVSLPKGNCYYVYQKIAGDYSSNWSGPSLLDIPDMTDSNVHVSKTFEKAEESTLWYEADFGSYSSGATEIIGIYTCVK